MHEQVFSLDGWIVNIYKMLILLLYMKKRGMEMVISTVVVVILAVLMLVIGTILIKTTTCKAKEGVDMMSDLGKQEIERLFSEQNDNVVAVKEITNDVPKATYYGIGFVIKNVDKTSNTKFTYTVHVLDLGDCSIAEKNAEDYIITGKSATVDITAGNIYSDVIEFKIPKNAPICSLRYEIKVENNREPYGSSMFIIRIKNAPLMNSLMC